MKKFIQSMLANHNEIKLEIFKDPRKISKYLEQNNTFPE